MSGLKADAAVERLLGLLGRPCPRDELLLLPDETASAEEIQEELLARGLIVRQVGATAADLRAIHLPTLAQLRDGSWLVVRSHRPDALLVETSGDPELVDDAALAEQLSGVALEITPAINLPGELWRVLVASALHDTKRVAAILVATLVVQILSLLPPQLTRLALDQALPQGAGSLLNAITLGLLFAGAFQAWTAWLRQRAILFLRVQMQVVLERGFLDHVLRLPFPVLRGRTVGDFMQAMFGLAEARSLVTDRAISVFLDGSTSALYLAVMAASMPAQTGAVALAGVLMAVVSALSGRSQAQLQRAEVQAQIKQRAFLIEGLSGIATIKGMGAETAVLRSWVELLLSQFSASLRRQRLGLSADIVLGGMRQALNVLVTIWGGYLALKGQVTLGTFIAFVQMSGAFLSGVLGLTNAFIAVMVLRPQLAKTTDLARLSPGARPRPATSQPAGPVILDEVWFRYSPDGPWVLSGHQLHVEAGEKCWIKGPSGWGKSTLLRLVAGLYPPERGSVRIGGHDPARTRGLVFFLPQLVHLYGGSIYDNLRILSSYASRNRILEAAQASGLAEFLKTLAMGLETSLPPGAFNLSGGQRQLVAITAAMASTRRVLLLDEAFVNLDGLSRSWLVNSPWFEDRTVIYVSHDTRFAAA